MVPRFARTVADTCKISRPAAYNQAFCLGTPTLTTF